MIRAYFREYRSVYLSYLMAVGSFLSLFLLYRLPFSFFVQSAIFSGTILLLLSLALFWKFHHRMSILEEIPHQEDLVWLNRPIDSRYLALMEREKNESKDLLLAYQTREEDLQAIVKMWSHQMKVPLAALSLMSQTHQLNETDVNHQLLRLDNYLANLLNYLKLSNHASDFRFEEVEVREIVVELVKKYRSQFLQKEIAIHIAGNWSLKTDKKWLGFALSQVLDNALKYNLVGGRVSIQLDRGIQIVDTGIGILPEDLPRLFDEGFTGYNGREHQKATGFGLYLTKRILTQLELDITISSQVEKGTCVAISLTAS